MTEQEWITCDDPKAMLLMPTSRPLSHRKLLLFGAALMQHSGWQEEFGGLPYARELVEWAETGVCPDRRKNSETGPRWWAHRLIEWAREHWGQPPALQAHILRDVAGNPFRWTKRHVGMVLHGLYADRLTPTVLAVAQAIYDEGRWGECPVLADALIEAGCVNEDILRHLASPGPHVKGCWAVDLILGKE